MVSHASPSASSTEPEQHSDDGAQVAFSINKGMNKDQEKEEQGEAKLTENKEQEGRVKYEHHVGQEHDEGGLIFILKEVHKSPDKERHRIKATKERTHVETMSPKKDAMASQANMPT